MIKSAKADCEKIWVLMMALFCGNTLCIARKSDEIRAQIFRKTPQAIYSAFAQGEAFDQQYTLAQHGKPTFLTSWKPAFGQVFFAKFSCFRIDKPILW